MPSALRQVLILLACAGGLAGLAGQFNHALSPLALTVTLPGLLIAYPALRLPSATGLTTALLVGLWLDAASPASFGRHAALLGLAFCLVHRMRWRLPREEALVGVVTAIFINLAVFVALALLDVGDLPDSGSAGARLLADLLVSQLATALVGPWFLALQHQSLRLAGAAPVEPSGRLL
jgi:rod shape-determining protein MreD